MAFRANTSTHTHTSTFAPTCTTILENKFACPPVHEVFSAASVRSSFTHTHTGSHNSGVGGSAPPPSSKKKKQVVSHDIRNFFNAAHTSLISPAAASSSPPTPSSSFFSTSSLTIAESPLATQFAFLDSQGGVSSRLELAHPLTSPISASPSSPPLPLLFPFLSSCLYCASDDSLLPILAFNYAVWQFRQPAHASRLEHPVEWLVDHVFNLAWLHFQSIKPKGRKLKKLIDTAGERAAHDAIVGEMSDNTIVCYSDGSASPNPGPCGAGATLFLKSPDLLFDFGAALGRGTNNVAELYGLGIIFTQIVVLVKRFPNLSRALIFCDSKLALRAASSRKLPRTNVELSKAVRSAFLTASKRLAIDLHWIRGHVEFGGNERVDRISKAFASSPLNNTASILDVNFAAQSACHDWTPSYPLSGLPTKCFLLNLLKPVAGRVPGNIASLPIFNQVSTDSSPSEVKVLHSPVSLKRNRGPVQGSRRSSRISARALSTQPVPAHVITPVVEIVVHDSPPALTLDWDCSLIVDTNNIERTRERAQALTGIITTLNT